MCAPVLSELWSEEKVAQALCVAVGTLRKWRRCGSGPAFLKLGACVRYEPAAIIAYLETRRRSCTTEEAPEIH
jgi:hypothetical protein